jgi:hypothetical protein
LFCEGWYEKVKDRNAVWQILSEHIRFYFPKVGYTRYDEVSLINRQDMVRLVALTNGERLFLISWNFLRKRFR